MMACSTGAWKWLLVDVLLCATVVIFIAISQFQIILPRKSGYFCNDPTIRLPYKGDTIPVELLLLINLTFPIIAVILVEKHRSNAGNCTLIPAEGFKPCLKSIGKVLLDFLIGKFFVFFLAEILKNVVAEHRPHFLYTCRPNVTQCGNNEFVSNYMCTNPDSSKSAINDSLKSFPSSHAISSFYSSVFVMLYLHLRARSLVSKLVCPWLHLMLFTWAICCGMSRVSDHRHHWWDVVAGGIIGSTFAVATVGMLCDWFFPRTNIKVSTIEDAQPEKRISTRRLISSSSSDQKELGPGNKTLESNHL